MKTCSIAFLAFALIHGSKTHPRSQFLHNVLKHALLFPPVLFFTSIQPVRFSLFSRFISHQIVFSSQNKSAVSAFQPTYKLKRTGPHFDRQAPAKKTSEYDTSLARFLGHLIISHCSQVYSC